MSKTIDIPAASRFEPSTAAQPTEAYIRAILQGTVFLARYEAPADPTRRPTWFEAAGWPAARTAR